MRKTIWIFIVAALFAIPFVWGGSQLAQKFALFSTEKSTSAGETAAAPKENSRDNTPILVAMNKKFHSGDAASAVKIADGYLAEFPGDVKVLSMRGWALSKIGKSKAADKSFDAAIALDQNHANAYVGKASLARLRGDFAVAETLYTKALALEPEDSFTLASFCALEISKEEYEKAVELCEAAFKNGDSVPFVAANLAVAYHKAGMVEKRDAMFKKVEELRYAQLDVMREMFYGKART